jgi:hypothetical protein
VPVIIDADPPKKNHFAVGHRHFLNRDPVESDPFLMVSGCVAQIRQGHQRKTSQQNFVCDFFASTQPVLKSVMAGMSDLLDAPPTLLDQARQDYPLLLNYDIAYKNNPGGGQGFMESWPAGETGTPQQPRPAEFSPNRFGVENYNPASRPIDLVGDVVSHHLVNIDPNIRQTYQQFTGSLQPWQEDILRGQYQHAQANAGETRPYEAWRAASGVPAYFRGYAFQQWPADFNQRAYTPQQLNSFDQMMQHLRSR